MTYKIVSEQDKLDFIELNKMWGLINPLKLRHHLSKQITYIHIDSDMNVSISH